MSLMNIIFPLSYQGNGAIFAACIVFARRGAYQAPIPAWRGDSRGHRDGGSVSAMQTDILKAIGRKSVIGLMPWPSRYQGSPHRVKRPAPDRRYFPVIVPVPVFARALALFVNPLPSTLPAAMKAVPLRPMPPRRRREALPSRCRGSGKRLPCAADPPLLQRPLLQPYRLPSCDPEQQKSIHHQARDTLQGDEGA